MAKGRVNRAMTMLKKNLRPAYLDTLPSCQWMNHWEGEQMWTTEVTALQMVGWDPRAILASCDSQKACPQHFLPRRSLYLVFELVRVLCPLYSYTSTIFILWPKDLRKIVISLAVISQLIHEACVGDPAWSGPGPLPPSSLFFLMSLDSKHLPTQALCPSSYLYLEHSSL